MAMSDSCREARWLFHILEELKIVSDKAIVLNIDNEGAEAIARNPSHHSRTKHIHARYHFVRGCVKDCVVILNHVPTTDMLADILTKGLGRVLLEKHRGNLNLL